MSGCAPLVTQSPGEGLSPVNAVSDGEDKHLMLFGHDVVSYFTDHHHQLGSPQFGGYCSNGIVYGIPWGGDADTREIFDGKLYIFGGKGSHDAFLLDVPHYKTGAELAAEVARAKAKS